MARQRGFPEERLQATVVSRWFVIPVTRVSFVVQEAVKHMLTYCLDTIPSPARPFQSGSRLCDALLRRLEYFLWVVIVPPGSS